MRKSVSIGLVVLAVILIVLDVFLALNGTQGDTYSEIIRDTGYRAPFLPWAVGGVAGHWFWNGKRYSNRYTWALVLSGLCVLEYCSLALGVSHPFVAFLVGMASGRLVWAMEARGA